MWKQYVIVATTLAVVASMLPDRCPFAHAAEQCAEENARLQAAVNEAQNAMIQKVILQGQVTLLQQELKALKEERAKADTNPKAESAAEPAPVPPQ